MNAIIEKVNSIGCAFIEFAWPMLIQASVLIALLLVADFVLRRRVRAVFRYWILMLILVKLMLPTSLSGPFSVGYWFGDEIASVDVSRNVYEPPSTMSEAPAPVLPYIDVSNVGPGVYSPPTATSVTKTEPISVEPISPPAVQIQWQGVVFLLWAAIAGALLLLLAQRAMFVRGLVAQAKAASRAMCDVLDDCRKGMKVRSRPSLKVSANATSPAVCGLFRPVILVPNNLSTALGAEDLEVVLLHELAHIKRGDLWVNLAQTLLQIIYFYNPLLWLANAVIRRAREQAVDEAVLVAMGEGASRYPQTLVSVAKLAFKRPTLSLRLIGVVESKSALTARIKRILSRPVPKSAKLGILGLVAIIITAAFILPMARARGYTDRAGKVMELAEAEARQLNHEYIGTEHILLALAEQSEGVAAKVLDKLGIAKDALQVELTKLVQPGSEAVTKSRLPQSPRAKKALEHARNEARALDRDYIGTEHILLGLMEEKNGVAAQMLAKLGVSYDVGRAEVLDFVKPGPGVKTDVQVNPGSARPEYSATLANGVTVEVVGICAHPSEGKQWWGVDGQAITRPYERLNRDERSGDSELYEVVYRLFGCDDILSTIYSNSEITGHVSVNPLSQKTEKLNISDAANAYGAILLVKPDAQFIRLEIGAGRDSDWKTLCSQSSPVDKTGTSGPGVVFQPAIEKDGKTHITIAHQIKDGQIRVIAVDQSGQIHESEGFLNTISGELGSCQVRFNLAAEKIKEIQFQTQKFQRVAFKDIPLRPGHKPDVQVEVEEAAAVSAESEVVTVPIVHAVQNKATLPNGVTVELLGLCKEPVVGAKLWKPDGGDMPVRSYEANKENPPMRAIPTQYTFLAKATGGQDVAMKMRIYEGFGFSTRTAGDGTALCYVKHPDPANTYHKDAFEKGPIEIGVAQGEWIKARGPYGDGSQIPRSYSLDSHDEIVIQPAQRESRSPEMTTQFWATASSHDYEYRMICKLKDGSTAEIMPPAYRSLNTIETGKLKNSKLETRPFEVDKPIDQIVDYELFYRKFEYGRFNNVAFRRDGKTDVQVEVESLEKASSGQPKYSATLANGATVELTGRVVDVQGEAIADAQVGLCTELTGAKFYWGRLEPLWKDAESRIVETDSLGFFDLGEHSEGDFDLVVVCDDGFAFVESKEFLASGEIRIRPWGRIEGQLAPGREASGNKIWMASLPNYTMLAHRWQLMDEGLCDGDGRFVFDRVPAGWFEVGFLVPTGRGGASITCRTPVVVEAGQTSNMTLGGTGRTVIGKFTPPAGYDEPIPFDEGLRSLVRARPKQPRPDDYEQMTEEQQRRWYLEWRKTDEYQKYLDAGWRNKNWRQYTFKIDEDGSFRIEDVIAGRYEMTVSIERLLFSGGMGSIEEIAGYYGTVEVPAIAGGGSDEPLDVGTLELHIVDEEPAGETASPQPAYSAKLANGVTVEVLGGCEHPSEGKQWWRPDGSLLKDSPYDDDFGRAFPRQGEKGYKFAVKYSGMAGGDFDAEVRLLNAKTTNGGALFSTSKKNGKENVKYLDGSLDEEIVWIGAAFDEEVAACDMRIGVCFGDWKRDYEYETDRPNDAVEWATFKNVSLKPNLRTDVRIDAGKGIFNDSGGDSKRYLNITIREGVPIRQALQVLGKSFEKNIIVSGKVSGQVPVTELFDVTFEEALQAVLGTHKYVIDGNLIRVYTEEEFESVPPEHEAAVPVQAGYEFGPVTERVVPSWNWRESNIWLDLDSGALVKATTPDEYGKDPVAWRMINGADITCSPENLSFTGYDMVVTETAGTSGNFYWNADPVELLHRLTLAPPESMNTIKVEKDENVSFLFKTREGGLGILQIVGFTAQSKSMKVRYKILKRKVAEKTDAEGALEKGASNDSGGDSKRYPHITFKEGMSLRDALRFLGEAHKKNIIVSGKVVGQVPVTELFDVTFEEALQAVLGTHRYTIDGDLIRVYTKEEFEAINPGHETGVQAEANSGGGKYSAVLANGARVELAAHLNPAEGGLKWYSFDGKPTTVEGVTEADVDGIGRVLALRVVPSADIQLLVRSYRREESTPLEEWSVGSSDIWAVGLDEERRFVNLEVWVTRLPPFESHRIDLSGRDLAKEIVVNKFDIAKVSNVKARDANSCEVTFEYVEKRNWNRWIQFAVSDKAGKIYDLDIGRGSDSNIRFTVDLPIEELGGIVIRSRVGRPASAKFKNVSLDPSYQTDVQIEVEPIPEGYGPVDADASWGEAVDGVEVRLKSLRKSRKWQADEPYLFSIFEVDLRSERERILPNALGGSEFEIEWDGRWYAGTEMVDAIRSVGPSVATHRENVRLLLHSKTWREKGGAAPLEYTPGKHTVRAAFLAWPADGDQVDSIRALSNAVEIEITPAEENQFSWGSGADGVQVRLRPDKLVWDEGDDPTFKIDIRNVGTREMKTCLISSLALEVDGAVYPPRAWRQDGITPVVSFGPGDQHAIGARLSYFDVPDKGADKLALGKHTLKAVYLNNQSDSGLYTSLDKYDEMALASSNAVDIEIVTATSNAGSQTDVPAMIEEIKKRSDRGWAAVGVLSKMGPEAEEAIEWLIEAGLDKDLRFGDGRQSPTAYRGSVLYSLSRMTWARDRVLPVLQKVAEDSEEDSGVRRQVILALRDVGKEAIPILREVIETQEDEIRDAAHHMLAQVLQREQGLSKDDYYTPLIEKDPFGASIPEYLAVMKSPKSAGGLGGLHPVTQKIKKLYRERLANQPDPELAWRLAGIIQNGLRNTELMWAAPTDGSKVRWPREDPTENYTTLAEVLRLGFDHAESGSELQRRFGISLAKLRLLQGDWDGMNAMLKELGQEPIPKESREWLHAPPVDWEEGLAWQWKRADESMRSGNCSLKFRIEKDGKGLKGVHFLVKRAPEPTNVINTGISIDTLFFEPYPLTCFSSFGYKAADRAMARYAVSDESGIVRFEKLPKIPIKIEVLVPTSNFPEAVSNWDLWMEFEPGKFKIAKKYGAGAINTQAPPAVAELKEGQTVHYPKLVVRVEG